MRLAGWLVGASLLWALCAPGYARGLELLGRPLIRQLEGAAPTRYEVAQGRIVAHRQVWMPGRAQWAPVAQPIWAGAQNFGLPLLAALVAATPGWSRRRRWRALVWGLALLSLTQFAQVLVTVEATQHSPVMSVEGPVYLPAFSAARQPVLYALYYFFELMGRGFFALLVYAGLVAFSTEPRPRPAAGAVGRNDPCPCGSGVKYKRCHGAVR